MRLTPGLSRQCTGFLIVLFIQAVHLYPPILTFIPGFSPLVPFIERTIGPKEAEASFKFIPTGQELVTGTNPATVAATAAATEGVNTGDYRGTFANDNFHWVAAGTTSGINMQLVLGNVELNGANTIMFQTEFDLDATAHSTLVQVCDWVSSTGVDNAADSQCTTGGWRTLNYRDTAITTTTPTSYHWQIYNGYWSDGSNTPLDTPLTNFVNGSNQIRVRYFSSTNSTSTVAVDYLWAIAVVNPLYTAADFTNLGSGTVTGEYRDTTTLASTMSDDQRLRVAGTAGSVSDFYLSFNNVETYTGMNTILVRAEYSCSATGINHRPKIWNFTTDAWVDLSTTSIACSATDAINMFAINNITISDYVENGEVRIGWRGLSNAATELRIDYIYIMLGTTNTDTGDCEISFGTNSAGDCANTRNIDTTATVSTWNIAAEDESNTFGHTYYALDNDADGTVEEAAASHVRFNVTKPAGSTVAGVFYAGRYMSGTAGTVQFGLRDYSGLNQTTGGFTALGATSTTALTYTDNVTVNLFGSGGFAGLITDAEDYIDTNNNEMWLRLRTTVSGGTANNSVNQFDFAFVSFSWIIDDAHVTNRHQYTPTSTNRVLGTEVTIFSATATNNEGVNLGSINGTLADDGFHHEIQSTTTGVNFQYSFANVQLQGANAMQIQTEFDLDATVAATAVQICDWVSSTDVENAADAQCTTGGWRTLNNLEATITTATATAYHWQIYNGYWSNGNTPTNTPLTNFVNNGTVLIRFFSTTNTTGFLAVDYIRIMPVVNPVYFPAGFTNLGSGSVTSDYRSTSVVTQGASDNTRLQVAGTAGSVFDFYLPFKNVKTYTGMNTIMVRAEYSCSATGINHRPKIWNFTTDAWVDLSTSSIACSATDATNMFALNNITISDYVENGEVRIGWRGLSNAATAFRVDFMYIMLGTTNTDTGECEIGFGTNNAGDCANTRTIDTTATVSQWTVNTEDESNTFGHTYYPLDNDADANVEEASSEHIRFSATLPDYAASSAVYIANRITSGTGITKAIELLDFSGINVANGGFQALGSTVAAATSFQDNISVGGVGNGGAAGAYRFGADFVNEVTDEIWMRVRSAASGTTTNNATNSWDFAMASMQWSEPSILTVGTTGTQLANVSPSTSDNHIGTFTFVRDFGTGTVSSITIAETGTIAANTNMSNIDIYYETAGTCTYNATETLFGTDTAFDGSQDAVVTGSMSVGTSQVCVYVVADVGSGASNGDTIELEIADPQDEVVVNNGDVTPATAVAVSGTTTVSSSAPPDDPTSLAQLETDDTNISTGGWVSATSIKFNATADDPDSSDTLQLCVEVDQLGTGFSNTEDACGSGVAFSGTPVTVTITRAGLTDATEYHWQARVRDSGGGYSNWVAYGGNAESARDFGLDTTAASTGTVYDGTTTDVDVSFNTGSLSQLSANWSGFNANVSGLASYDYSIGTTAGATDVRNWTGNSTTTSVTATGLTLQTSQQYFFNVRLIDNAGNTSSVVSSNGQMVAPSLSFSLSGSSVAFNNLNAGNSFADTETTTLTTSTNAYNGYVIRAFRTDLMRSTIYPSTTIQDFDAGTYAAPSAWGGANYGYGYTSSDTSVQGAGKFPSSGSCLGTGTAPCYAPFSSTAPGDIVADHLTTVTGSPISSEQFTITYRIQVPNTQPASPYTTSIIYTIVPQY